jgi:hypothetical protein
VAAMKVVPHSRGSTVAGKMYGVNLSVEPVNGTTYDAVCALEVFPEQRRFIRQPSMMLFVAELESNPDGDSRVQSSSRIFRALLG